MSAVLMLAASKPQRPASQRAKDRPLSKERLVRLVRNSRDDAQFRQLQLRSFVKQHLRRSAGVPEEEALRVLTRITAPFVEGGGTARDREILEDTGDLLFHFERPSQLEGKVNKGAQDLLEAVDALKKASAVDASSWLGLQGNFEWLITDFSKQQGTLYSPVHILDGLPWRFQLYPEGNHHAAHLSAYIYIATDDPKGRQRVEYSITVVNQLDPSRNQTVGPTVSVFEGTQSWGWTCLMPLKKLADKSAGWVLYDTLQIVASVKRLVG